MGVLRQSMPLALVFCLFGACGLAEQPEVKEMRKPRTIGQVLDLLGQSGFEAVVLRSRDKKKIVVVTPELVGRVLCVGGDGIDGPTGSYYCEAQIRRGFDSPWSNFGGEQRIWITPEFGPQGLFITKGEQTMDNYKVPPALNATRFKVADRSSDGRSVTSAATMTLVNRLGTRFQFKVEQTVECLESCPYLAAGSGKGTFVGFKMRTTLENAGAAAWTKESGPLAIWTAGQFPAGEGTVAIMPFRPAAAPAKTLTTEYFKLFPPDPKPLPRPYWKLEAGCVLLRADGSVEKKFEIPAARARNRLASIDLTASSMTIVDYDDLDPAGEYVKSFPQPYEDENCGGGAMSAMLLHGHPPEPPLHELETCSPALFLKPGEKRAHTVCTYHIKADQRTLADLCRRCLNAELEAVIDFNKTLNPTAK